MFVMKNVYAKKANDVFLDFKIPAELKNSRSVETIKKHVLRKKTRYNSETFSFIPRIWVQLRSF